MKAFKTATFSALGKLAHEIQNGSRADCIAAIDALIAQKTEERKTAWIRELTALRGFICGETGPKWQIFKLDGNSKLPFAAFSSLPGVTCPGAGDCLDYCYSFRSWRYPAAFCRQAQNAWLLQRNPQAITEAFMSLPLDITLRLYVDGDFATGADVAYWMERLRARPDVQAYGYSKSFRELLTYYKEWPYWPKNYMLNLSGGHNHDTKTVDAMKALSITRGTFDAVSIGRKVKSTDHGSVSVNKALVGITGKGIFPCPGKCGDCRKGEHACGSEKLRGIPIVIAVH